MDQLRQILFLCICPGVSHCNRDRNVTLFNLRSDLPYDLFCFFGCLVFQDNHELITADSVTLTVLSNGSSHTLCDRDNKLITFLLVSLQICTKIHFYITTKFFTLQCTYLFRRCFSCFLFQKIATKENFFSNAPLRFLFFFFSVRSIRNAPSPLPRRPARRYRLRTLCTDPESHHVFQAQWCVRRTGTW